MMTTLLKEERSSIWDSCEATVFPTDIYSSQIPTSFSVAPPSPLPPEYEV
jgi:hypothetical protein